jgi:hypothetical protein
MDAAQTIRAAVSRVTDFRKAAESNPALHAALVDVKRFQSRRFAWTYADLLNSEVYQLAARFFLDELYGDRDYSIRDAQFARIAGALQKIFPSQAVATAVTLANVHAMTEQFDHEMGLAWLAQTSESPPTDAWRYVNAWKLVGRPVDRTLQLEGILELGRDLDRLTRKPGLRLMLKMMRRPARTAGLSDLQEFLESGFDIFARLSKVGDETGKFLSMVEQRESSLMKELFLLDAPFLAEKFAPCNRPSPIVK